MVKHYTVVVTSVVVLQLVLLVMVPLVKVLKQLVTQLCMVNMHYI